jgi:hypothetical protein
LPSTFSDPVRFRRALPEGRVAALWQGFPQPLVIRSKALFHPLH